MEVRAQGRIQARGDERCFLFSSSQGRRGVQGRLRNGWDGALQSSHGPGLTEAPKSKGTERGPHGRAEGSGGGSQPRRARDPGPGCSGTSRLGWRAQTWPQAAISPLV